MSFFYISRGILCGKTYNSGSCDPYWNNVVLALHGDGVENGTVFTDEKGHLTTAPLATAVFTTNTNPKFNQCINFGGGLNARLSVSHSDEFQLSNLDFTIDFWIRTTSAANQVIMDARTSAANLGWLVTKSAANPTKITFFMGDANTSAFEVALVSTTSVNTGDWFYVQIVRQGTAFYLFVNGVIEATTTSSVICAGVNTSTVSIGGSVASGSIFTGALDDIRVTIGSARNTANFTPPTEPFGNFAC